MKTLMSFLFIFFVMAAHAQVGFEQVSYRGSGCPQGSVSYVVSPDGSSLSLIFDEFRSEVPQYDQNNDNDSLPPNRRRNKNAAYLNHKNCSLSFSASLPQGQKADSLEVSLGARGAAILDEGVEGFFASILVGYSGLAQSRGRPTILVQKHWRALRGPLQEDFIAEPKAVIALQSGCSSSQSKMIRFDLKNHIQTEIQDMNLNKSGLITMDSVDMRGMLKFTLRTRSCGSGRMSP